MFVNNTLSRNSSFIEKKKTPRWIPLNLCSNWAHNFVKHLVAFLADMALLLIFDTFPRSLDTGHDLYYNYQKP